MNIWLKELTIDDDKKYFDVLKELASYENVYARPVPKDFDYSEFAEFKKARIKMKENKDLPSYALPASTYWVMNSNDIIGYATLKHRVDFKKPGGHFGLCLKKEYQNKGIGNIVADLLSDIAYNELGIEEIIYTAKNENIQSQKSIEKIGAELIDVYNGYHYYKLNLKEKYETKGRYL